MSRHRKQRGVALIFALGILSLILVMGMAFLGNALISQKIAINSRETASARLTARSALDRAMTQLVLFNLTQCGQLASSYLSPEVSSVFSRIGTGAAAPLGDVQGDTKDQLAGNDSKLNVGPSDMRLYPGKRSRARWIYVHQNGTETDGMQTGQPAIIARYAYQVLPPIARDTGTFSLNSLSLYAVTSGADGVAGVNSDAANRRKAQTHRWGIDADELCISDLPMFSAHWTGASPWSPQHEFDNFQNLLSGTSGTNPFYWNKTDADAKKLVESRKRWLRYVFTEGRGRTAREAFSNGAGVWYTRFNLSDGTPFYDGNEDSNGNWYSRLLTEKPANATAEADAINGKAAPPLAALKNSASAVENLARFPDPFEDGFYYDKDGIDAGDPFSLGIPFLKRIGSNTEKGAFETVENLRKQIAANLNDYCDSDSVPTSDVAASTWGDLIDNSLTSIVPPAYTGNEKTLYINEVAFGFKLASSKLSTDGGGLVFKFDGAGDQLKTEFITELVGIYKDLPSSYDLMELKGKIHSLKAKLKVSLKGKVTVQYTKADSPHSEEVDLGAGGISAEKVFELDPEKDRNIDIKSTNTPSPWSDGANRYWLGRVDLTSKMKTGVTVDLKDLVTPLNNTEGNPISVTAIDKIEEIKVELVEISFDLGNIALFLRDKAADATVDSWVDFVRVAKGERSPTGTLTLLALNKSTSDTGNWFDSKLSEATGNTKGFFYCGSMQAIDPRQNLNAKLSNDEPNDWHTAFTPTIELPELTSSSENYWDKFGSRLKGAVNVCSNPSAPKDAKNTDPLTVGVDCDKETATDPAWQGDGADKHISTAVIRNKPMRSPWELGFIHRGIPFQTINLKKAGGIDGSADLSDNAHSPGNFSNWASETGTKYEHGDAGILDEIKMTEYNKSFGKIDVSTLVSAAPPWWVGPDSGTETFENHNKALYKALFRNIRVEQKAEDFLSESANLSTVTGTLTGTVFSSVPESLPPSTSTSVQLRSKFLKDQQSTFKTDADDDARQEELIGKTVNLIDANSCSPGNVYWIVIVAQTIRDQEGAGTLGKFDVTFPDTSDPEKNVYTDEILGECRMLATVEKITCLEGADKIPRMKLRVRQIEYLD